MALTKAEKLQTRLDEAVSSLENISCVLPDLDAAEARLFAIIEIVEPKLNNHSFCKAFTPKQLQDLRGTIDAAKKWRSQG